MVFCTYRYYLKLVSWSVSKICEDNYHLTQVDSSVEIKQVIMYNTVKRPSTDYLFST